MATEDLRIRVMADGTIAVQRQIEGIGTSAKKASRDVNLLSRTLSTLGVGLVLHEFVQLADGLVSTRNRLTNVTNSTAELNAVMTELLAISNRTRSSFEDNANLYNRMALATRQFGISQAELLRITETMNQAIILSGVRTQEASNALIQLSQGMNSGRLQGDELRSVLEQLPPVADILAKQLGVTRGELRKLGSEGKITTQVIIEAFQTAEEEIAAKFAQMAPTIGQAMVVLRNSIIETIGELDKATGFTNAISQSILFLANNMETLTRVATALAIVLGPAMLTGALSIATGAVVMFTLALATNPILAVITAIAALVAIVVVFGDKIMLTNDSLTNLQDLGWAVWESIASGAQMAWDMVRPFLDSLVSMVGEIDWTLKGFFDGVIWYLDQIVRYTTGSILAMIEMYKGLPDAAGEQFINLANIAIGAIETAVNETVRFLVLLPERMLNIVTDAINLMIDAFVAFVDWLKNLPQAIADVFGNAMEMAKQKVFEGIDYIASLFEVIPGIQIPDLVPDDMDIVDLGVSGLLTVTDALEGIADGYQAIKDGYDVLELDPLDNQFLGSSEKLGENVGAAFERGLENSAVSDWWEKTLARADEIAQKRQDAARILGQDDANNAGILNNPIGAGGFTAPANDNDAGSAKEMKRLKQLKDELASLEAALDNQILADRGRIREIENTQAEQLNVIKAALAARILTEEEAAERIVAIRETAARKIRDIEYARYSEILSAATQTFDSLASVAKDFAGEQSGIYKAMFVASKAFAIADSIIKIQQGIANALSLPFPANLGAVATVAAQAASIVSNIQAVSLALASGGYVSGPGTGTSDSIPAMLSNGEYVVNAQATRAFRPLLESINSGAMTPSSLASTSGTVVGGGVKVEIVDQRRSGAPIDVTSGTNENGEAYIRAIVRDEAQTLQDQTARNRYQETVTSVQSARKRGAL